MGSNAPVDHEVLELLRQRARTHPLVERIESERTAGMVSTVVLELDAARYPDRVVEARLEFRWYTNGDYNAHYVETHADSERWQCRWDRHPNPHATRGHFHPPPDADSASAVADDSAPHHPGELFTRTFANVRQRIGQCWDVTE